MKIAAGSGAAAVWSLLLVSWLGRRRRSRREALGAGLALVALGGLASGSVAAFAGCLTAAALKVQQIATYEIASDLMHYAAYFLAWYFICLLLFSIEHSARIEEGVARLRILMLKAEDAALRERVRPDFLSGAFARIGAALSRRRRKEAESVVMTLAESLRAALSSQARDALQEGRRTFEGADVVEVGLIDAEATWFGARFAKLRLADRVFWVFVFAILFISLAPVYVHSALRTKAFVFMYWLSFCIIGLVACVGLRKLWTAQSASMAIGNKCSMAVAASIGAALVSACFPSMVAAVFWRRVAPNFAIIMSGADCYFPIYAVWHCVYFHGEALRREVAQRAVLAQAAEAAAAARNSMLRYQVRPHFLFNALNALHALIADGRWEHAGAMTEAMSAYIERSFAEDERELVPIREQAEALQTYLSIERVRFGDRLRIRVDIPEQLAHACAPSLILHPLVENAMKYAVAATGEPVDVEIAADLIGDTVLLRVRDSGGDPEAPAAPPGLGIGLRNVAARLAGHYGERALLECKRLTPKGFVAEIRLPLEFACTTFAA